AFFCQAEDGIRDRNVTGVQTCALPILHMTRSDYIRHALEDYNSKNEQVLYKKQLAESVQEVREQTDTELTEMDASVEDGLSDARSEERRVGKAGRAQVGAAEESEGEEL